MPNTSTARLRVQRLHDGVHRANQQIRRASLRAKRRPLRAPGLHVRNLEHLRTQSSGERGAFFGIRHSRRRVARHLRKGAVRERLGGRVGRRGRGDEGTRGRVRRAGIVGGATPEAAGGRRDRPPTPDARPRGRWRLVPSLDARAVFPPFFEPAFAARLVVGVAPRASGRRRVLLPELRRGRRGARRLRRLHLSLEIHLGGRRRDRPSGPRLARLRGLRRRRGVGGAAGAVAGLDARRLGLLVGARIAGGDAERVSVVESTFFTSDRAVEGAAVGDCSASSFPRRASSNPPSRGRASSRTPRTPTRRTASRRFCSRRRREKIRRTRRRRERRRERRRGRGLPRLRSASGPAQPWKPPPTSPPSPCARARAALAPRGARDLPRREPPPQKPPPPLSLSSPPLKRRTPRQPWPPPGRRGRCRELARPVRIAAHPLGALGGAAGSETVADSITSATSPATATDPSFPEPPFDSRIRPSSPSPSRRRLRQSRYFAARPNVSRSSPSPTRHRRRPPRRTRGSLTRRDRIGLRSARRRTRLASAASRSRRKSTESDTPDLSVRVQRRVACIERQGSSRGASRELERERAVAALPRAALVQHARRSLAGRGKRGAVSVGMEKSRDGRRDG